MIPVYGRNAHLSWEFIGNEYTLLGIAILLSVLMVSWLPMISLKFRNLKWQDYWAGYTLVGSAAVLLPFFQATAIPITIVLYILVSIAGNYFRKNNH
jgi:CDP-diacylglycerol--serine O-phosphatidyltransferase